MLLKMAAGDKAGPRQECASSLQFYGGSRRLKDEKGNLLATGVIGRGKKEEGESCSEVLVWGELQQSIEGLARASICQQQPQPLVQGLT
jgi:hypothetical protein